MTIGASRPGRKVRPRPPPDHRLVRASTGTPWVYPGPRRWPAFSCSLRPGSVPGLGLRPLFLRARAGLVGPHHGAVNPRVFGVGLPGSVREPLLPSLAFRPATPAPRHILPGAEARRQSPPRHPGPRARQHRFHKPPVVHRRAAPRTPTARQEGLDSFPWIVAPSITSPLPLTSWSGSLILLFGSVPAKVDY